MFYKSYNFEYQRSSTGNVLCHTMRVLWEGNPREGEGHIIASAHKTFFVTDSSHNRLTKLANSLVNCDLGKVTFWPNSSFSWNYMPNLVHYTEAGDRWIQRFKPSDYNESTFEEVQVYD